MGIKATIIAHSKSLVSGKEIVTFELEYPRIIHSELMTHRLFSRNASSSRAIPVSKVIEMVRTNPAMPVRFGANQAGMQDKGQEHDAAIFVDAVNLPPREAWQLAAGDAADWAELFAKAGYHKQICNRLTEPFQWMKTLVTATEYYNFFWLRRDEDADPTIKQLADSMWDALQKSTPHILPHGYWHTPYFENGFWGPGVPVELEEALAISSSCCAQVSYRKLDSSLEKAEDIRGKLINGRKVHGSPFEHQAKCMKPSYMHNQDWPSRPSLNTSDPSTWEEGITHIDRGGKLWSGNFKGWIQHRQLIPKNVCWEYRE